jgi:L-fuculose-phosphate aldolase
MNATEEQIRAAMVAISHRVWERGWVANHDGNLSARLEGGRFVCTPTAVSKIAIAPETLIVVNEAGERIEGTRKVFSEWQLHRAAYTARSEVRAVLHAHPPTATAFAVAGVELGAPFLAEPVVSLGARVPLVSYFLPGHPGIDDALSAALGTAEVVLLQNHGVLAVGPDLETCYLRMELVEHLARIAFLAEKLGGAKPIPRSDVDALLARRAGGSAPPLVAAGAGAPQVSASDDAFAIVAEALERLN